MKNNDSLVSIIMPVYNGGVLIRQSIESLLRQTYNNWECIIINDGSTDDTKEYLDSLTDTRFKVYSFEKNKGRPYARQKGLEMACGKYLAMLDADDIYHPDKLSIQIKLLEENPSVALVSSGMCLYGRNVDFIKIMGKGTGEVCFYKNSKFCPVCHASSILRMDMAKKLKYNKSLKQGEDGDFLKRYLLGKKYIKQQEVLYYYSMFDSVSKVKLISDTLCHIRNYKKEGEYLNCIILLIKLLLQKICFLFLDIKTILSFKGESPTDEEILQYKKNCYPYIKS